jgi:hypothetical protein
MDGKNMHQDTQLGYARDFAEKLESLRGNTQVIQDAVLGSPRTNGVGLDERLVDLWKMQKQCYDRLDGVRNILWVIASILLIHTVHHW